MRPLAPDSAASLAPVREALASAARARVQEIERTARADAEAVLETANQERERLHAAAEAAGVAEATAAVALTAGPRYPAILERLIARAVKLLGPAAAVTPHSDGGVTAVAGTRTLDLTLPTLAARTLDSMSTEVASLWETS